MPPQLSPGQPILSPPEFPLRWERADQAGQLWALDRQHFGRPLPPLAADVWRQLSVAGANRALAHYQLPVRIEMLVLNGYLYSCYQPVGLPPAVIQRGLLQIERVWPQGFAAIQRRVAARLAARYLPLVEPAAAGLAARWAGEWLPAIRAHLAWWRAFDLAGASLAALAAHLAESLLRIERLWELHFLLVLPAFFATSRLEDFCREQLAEAEDVGEHLSSSPLVQGFDNSFLQADRALWQISRTVRTLPAVRDLIERLPSDAALAALADFPEGQIVASELHAWLAAYGWRASVSDGLGDASWIEHPSLLVGLLREIAQQPDRDLAAELLAQAAEREAAVERARQRLSLRPAELRVQFERYLEAAQAATALLVEHNFWIDQQAMACLRRVLLELGRCTLGRADDILFLTLDEAQALAEGAAGEWPALVAARRAQHAADGALAPPEFVGTMPLLAPPASDPFARAMRRVLGDAGSVPTGARANAAGPLSLVGAAASAGVARGRARVLRTLGEQSRLQPGEILVAEATMPPWTPLFALAAAIVTESGGILCHAAVVAREYGIPAVVGAACATSAIHDGDLIEVDGGAGTVVVLGQAQA